MISRSATILAVALPIGLVLLAFALTTLILYLRVAGYRRRSQSLEQEIKVLQEKYDTLTKTDIAGSGSFLVIEEQLTPSYYKAIQSPHFISTWMSFANREPPTQAEIDRFQAALFPELPRYDDGKRQTITGKDLNYFPNPHGHSVEEILTIIHQGRSASIVEHIMNSVLLIHSSVYGDPYKSLLPFNPTVLHGFYNLNMAIRGGLQLGDTLHDWVCRYTCFHANSSYSKKNGVPLQAYFNNLFQPYFKSSSPEDKAKRDAHLDQLIANAIAHGVICLGYTAPVVYSWGDRGENIVIEPSMLELTEPSSGGPTFMKEIVSCVRS